MKTKTYVILLLGVLLQVRPFVAATDTLQGEAGFVSLFNGRDLTGWGYAGPPFESFDGKAASADGRYEVKDGVVVVNERVPRTMQRMVTLQQFPSDFVLRLEFRAGVAADSGVFIRGVQLQCRDYLAVGPYYDLTKHRPQDWNAIEIVVKGGKAYATSNDQVLEPSLTLPASGPVGLEGDLGVMEYRRIRIKEIPKGGTAIAPVSAAARPVRTARIDRAAFDRPIRLAVIGDDLTQPKGASSGGGRGGAVQLPDASARQQAAVNAMIAANARFNQGVIDARTALTAASLTVPALPAEVTAKAAALASAELTLALARADAFEWLQASPGRLDATLTAALAQQTVAPGGVAAAAARSGLVPPTDYPSQLGSLLGERWDVRNFGVSGAVVLKNGDTSYWKEPALEAALSFNPDAVVIMFGTNESRPENWRLAGSFVADYKALIGALGALPARPAIWIAKPPPAFTSAGGVNGQLISGEIMARLDAIARESGAGVVNIFGAMRASANLTLDGVHPDPAGARIIAATVQAALMR